MKRRALFPAALLAACGRKPLALPQTVDGWRRAAPRQAQAPSMLQPSLRRATAADYEGPGKATVTLFELSSSAAALDAAQRWQPSANTVFFPRGNAFVVVNWREGDRKTVSAFVRALENTFPR